ncbi:hypothetical protein [Gilvibacter sp.]|uniref:hypothetical protein n=1 Tax=Gilvibacter sp. TaxID=2729997 RepID=UPI003B51F028
MKNYTYISQLAALFFLGLLLFPTASQYVHVLDLHQHEVCIETDVHMHEDAPVCELDDLRLPLFDELFFSELEEPLAQKVLVSYPNWLDSTHKARAISATGRAPPLA